MYGTWRTATIYIKVLTEAAKQDIWHHALKQKTNYVITGAAIRA